MGAVSGAEFPRRFEIHRDHDVTGASGTGHVASGVRLVDNTAVVCWLGDKPSTVVWLDFAHAEAVHGHGGATRFVWGGVVETREEVQMLWDLVRSAKNARTIVIGRAR